MTVKSTKKISGDYEIYAGANVAGTYTGTVRVYGNLDVVGNTTYIESTNTQIKDAIITLNDGEVGAGVTSVYSGIEVERGSLPNVKLRWNETYDRWEGTPDGTNYFDIIFGTGGVPTAAGNTTEVQFNNAGPIGANVNFTYDPATNTLTAGGVSLNNYTVSTNNTNQDLTLDPNGTGRLVVNASMKLQYQGSAPTASASNVFIYSNTPGNGGSGLYYVNNNDSDELVSKKKAQLYAWIF